MTEKVDMKQLLYAINDKKQMDVNFCMDEGCQLITTDKTALIKVINYLMNYMNSITETTLELGLELLPRKFVLNIISTISTSPPDISNAISTMLSADQIQFDYIHVEDKYVQIKLSCPRILN